MDGLNINMRETEKRIINLSSEISASRLIYRESGIFAGKEDKEFTTMNKKSLEREFLNCVSTCESNKDQYYKAHLQHKKPCMRNVIRFSSDYETAMNTNTIQNIRQTIQEKLTQLPDCLSEFYENSMKNASKDQLCGILESVESDIEEIEMEENSTLFQECFYSD